MPKVSTIVMQKVSTKLVVLLILASIGVTSAQKKPAEKDVAAKTDAAKDKGAQILKQAKETISKKVKVSDIKSLAINISSAEQIVIPTRQDRTIQGNIEKEFGLILPNKIRQNFSGDYTTNQSTATWILNGSLFSLKTNVTVNGEPVGVDIDNAVSKERNISQLKYDVFINIFPVLLDCAWYVPLEFAYVGVAEAKDGRAEVLEAQTGNGTKYRLFFDAETYLLLMMTENWKNKENKLFENKYFYSDYQEKDGLLAATRIVVEKNGKVSEEKTIKNIKINPTFKPNFFDVK